MALESSLKQPRQFDAKLLRILSKIKVAELDDKIYSPVNFFQHDEGSGSIAQGRGLKSKIRPWRNKFLGTSVV